jgi:hypothetical protein
MQQFILYEFMNQEFFFSCQSHAKFNGVNFLQWTTYKLEVFRGGILICTVQVYLLRTG